MDAEKAIIRKIDDAMHYNAFVLKGGNLLMDGARIDSFTTLDLIVTDQELKIFPI